MSPCPSRQQLEQYLDEALAPAEQGTLESHLERCPTCQDQLRNLTDDAGVRHWRHLRELLPPNPPAAPRARLPQVPGYEVFSVLGRGGMGVVFQARDVRLNRLVALKMIRSGALAGPREVARFRREAEAVARLQHPGIIAIYEVGEVDGTPYCALELVPGGTLEKHTDGTPQPPRLAARLVQTLARTVQHAHERGVVHRDLKPANVLLSDVAASFQLADSQEGKLETCRHVKIADFGIARCLDAPAGVSSTGQLVGTPGYMAPEQAAGRKDLGPAVDVYSLGAILYELLTGRPPFRAGTPLDTVLQVMHEEPVPPSRLHSGTPRDLETICLKCLAKEPARRYASAADLADDLQRFLDGRTIRARPAGLPERLWRAARRNPREAALAALGLIGILLAAGGWGWYAEEKAGRALDALHAGQTLARRQADTARVVSAALDEASRLRGQRRTAEALSAARQAQALLEQGEPDEELHRRAARQLDELEREERADRAEADRQARDRALLEKLESLRLTVVVTDNRFHNPDAIPGYEAAFRDEGIDLDRLEPAEAARRIRGRTVRAQMTEALDELIVLRRGRGMAWRRLLAVARLADPDPWRNRLRDALAGGDQQAVRKLADDPRLPDAPATSLTRLGNALYHDGALELAIRVLREAQRRAPGDFWVNHALALAFYGLGPRGSDDAVRYFSVAVGLRPSPGAYHNLGLALARKGALQEAQEAHQEAVRRGPTYAEPRHALGWLLMNSDRPEEAVPLFREAARLRPEARNWFSLGRALASVLDVDGAAAAYREAIRLRPDHAEAHCNLGAVLRQQGNLAASLASLQRGHDLGTRLPAWPYPTAEEIRHTRILLRMEAHLPAVLRGEVKLPPQQRYMFAELCRLKGQPTQAARLFVEAFAADPSLAERLDLSSRTRAARAAAAAGWRPHAIEWLRAELRAWTKRSGGTAKDRAAAARALRGWRLDPSLAPVRDSSALDRLPEPERDAWQRLWADVQVLRARCAAGK